MPGRELDGALDRAAVHHRPLQAEHVLDPFAGLDSVHLLARDQRRGAQRQRGADRTMALQHRPHRQQVVAQALERGGALAAHLEAADRPGEGAVGIRARLQRGPELDQLLGLGLAQPVAAGARRRGAGGDPPPAALAGGGEGVRPHADATALEEPHHADQLAQLQQCRIGPLLGVLLGHRQVLGLPGRAAHPLAAHRIDRSLDRVGADDADPARQLQARHRHPQADDRDEQHLGLVGVARFGVERRQRRVQPLAVEGKSGGALPELGEEGGQHQLGALAGVGRHALPPLLQIRSGDAGFDRRLAGGREARQRPQLLAVLDDVAAGHRHVAVEG